MTVTRRTFVALLAGLPLLSLSLNPPRVRRPLPQPPQTVTASGGLIIEVDFTDPPQPPPAPRLTDAEAMAQWVAFGAGHEGTVSVDRGEAAWTHLDRDLAALEARTLEYRAATDRLAEDVVAWRARLLQARGDLAEQGAPA